MVTTKKDLFLIIISLSLFLLSSVFVGRGLSHLNMANLIGGKNNCAPNWQCESWTTCNSDGKSYRKCTNLNSCDDSIFPNINRNCALTPEILSAYQNDYEKKLSAIGGDNYKIKIDFTNGIPEQNDENCQYLNSIKPFCYYFNLPKNISIKFLGDSISENTASGIMISIKENIRKEIMTGIKSIKEPFTENSAGFYIYPTNVENIFYIVGGTTIKNNIMSWEEIYFDVLEQNIIFHANVGAGLGETKKSFVNIIENGQEKYYINTNLPDNCTYPGKYKMNGLFINGEDNNIFPYSLEFICDQSEKNYSSSVEVEPLALSRDFKTLHLFVHKYTNDTIRKDDVSWHYLFNLVTGNVKLDSNN